jgi:predicted RNase H-like nuclease (RuvC/YqgF family)
MVLKRSEIKKIIINKSIEQYVKIFNEGHEEGFKLGKKINDDEQVKELKRKNSSLTSKNELLNKRINFLIETINYAMSKFDFGNKKSLNAHPKEMSVYILKDIHSDLRRSLKELYEIGY